MSSILVINGPNINLLGSREPDIYGKRTLAEIVDKLTADADNLSHKLSHVQSNAEHELVDQVQQAKGRIDFIIINPAAFTHTSVALRDALLAVDIPFIEVHLSNPEAREDFRTKSFLSDIALGKISGFGSYSYTLALMAANDYLNKQG